PLAEMILAQGSSQESAESLARRFLNDEVATVEDALAGARDIVAEGISDNAMVRGSVREKALQYGRIVSEATKDAEKLDEKSVYEMYYAFDMRVNRLKPHQILALNRGETEKILRVKLELEDRDWLDPIYQVYRPSRRS